MNTNEHNPEQPNASANADAPSGKVATADVYAAWLLLGGLGRTFGEFETLYRMGGDAWLRGAIFNAARAKLAAAPTETPVAPCAANADEKENFCEICCLRKVAPKGDSVCACMGIQPYGMSLYPGENKLVPNHPSSGGEQWYKRAEVDSELSALRAKVEELTKEIQDDNARWADNYLRASDRVGDLLKEVDKARTEEVRWHQRLVVVSHAINGNEEALAHLEKDTDWLHAFKLVDLERAKKLRAERDSLRAQLAASEEDRWQPIETAPKDGTFVLLVEESGHTHICQWYSEDGYWRARIMDGDRKWNPTHWQPLPKPPAIVISPDPTKKHT